MRHLRKDSGGHLYKDYDGVLEFDDGGIVRGYVSTFDEVPDSYGDIVAPGAFADSLDAWRKSGNKIPLLYGHRTDDPKYNIGYLREFYEDERGLYVEAAFDADNETAQLCRRLANEGRLCKFSFAYDVKERADARLESGQFVNKLIKVDIFEASLVVIPANQNAVVTDVKDADVDTKSGRRNSKADETAVRDAIAHLNQAIVLLDGIVGGDLDEHEPDEAEGGEGDASPKGREAEDGVLAIYKDAVKTTYGGIHEQA